MLKDRHSPAGRGELRPWPMAALSRRRPRHAFWRGEDGVVAVEFALLSPLFLALILGTMVMSLYFATTIAISHAATEGARASVRGVSTATRGALAQARVATILTAYQPIITPANAVVTPAVGPTATTFQVTVAYPLTDGTVAWFFQVLAFATGTATLSGPTTISRTVVIGNGGY